jgi:hypothetical protein
MKMAETLMRVFHWIWDRLDVIAGVLAIPWGMFAVSLALVGWKKFRETSGADIYVILSSLDLEFIVFKERFIGFVYAGIQAKFTAVFAIGLVVSLFFLVLSSRVQYLITGPNLGSGNNPAGALFLCWAFAPVWMAIHFFAILAR